MLKNKGKKMEKKLGKSMKEKEGKGTGDSKEVNKNNEICERIWAGK